VDPDRAAGLVRAAGISVLDVDDGRTATIRMPGAGGPEFLSWGVLDPE
jgi:hypothetical protein